MNIRIIVSAITLLLLMSCQTSTQRHGYRVETGKMIDMIIDFQVAKAATFKYPIEQRDSVMLAYQEQIFVIHGVDPFDFEHDMKKLENNPEYFKEIYDQVKQRMDQMNASSLKEDSK